MYDTKLKVFSCNNCGKKVNTGEKCWTKWSFPPSIHAFQDKAIKSLEYENAPIICLDCAKEIMQKTF